jgi:hypothetical protein
MEKTDDVFMSPRFQEDVLILAGDIANTMEAGDVRPPWIPRSRSQVAMDQDDWAQNPCFILFYIILHRFIQYVLVLQWHKMTLCVPSLWDWLPRCLTHIRLVAQNLGRTGATRDAAAVEVSLRSHLLLSRRLSATGGWEYGL